MAKKSNLNKSESIIQPLIRSNNEPHIFETMKELPELVSVGYCKASDERNSWVSYKMTTKGNKIIKIECDEPNLRQIAEESAKISFVSSFVDEEAL